MLKNLLRYLGLFLCLVCFSPFALAQFNASLSGTVEDPSGAVLSGATVTLTNTATQATQTTTTGASGFYRFSELPPGSYTVNVTAANFRTQTLTDVSIAAESPRIVNITLQVGGTSQAVNVNGNALSVLQTGDATISSTIGAAAVTRLPIFGRDPYELLRTGVGIAGDGARSGSGGAITLPNNASQNQSNYGIFQSENQVQISAAGQRVTSNTYEIDGVTVDSLLHGGSTIITPNPESIESIKIVTSNYDAEYGRNVGAHILTTTKSGTNTPHGSLFFQYDQPGLNAYQPYGGPTATPGVFAPPVRDDNAQREWAASLGFPIFKNKLFLFASYEAAKSSLQTFSETYVPTSQFYSGLAAARTGGKVSGTITPVSGRARVNAILPGNCTALQTICAPAGNGFDIGSFAGAVGQYLPNVNADGSPAAPNLFTGAGLDGVPDMEFAQISTPSQYRGTQFNGRVDWSIRSGDRLTGSFFTQKLDQSSFDAASGAAPDTNLPFKPFNSMVTFVYVHTFSPTLLNEARANYTRFADNQINDTKGNVNWGTPGMYVQNYVFGSLDLSNRSNPDTPAIFAENTYEVRDMVTKIAGPHAIRLGGVYRAEQDNDNLSGLARPNYAFQGIWDAANDAPLFEGIAANPVGGGIGNAARYFRDIYGAAFVQDDWQVKPNLIVNLGLRWEYFGALRNKTFPINQLQLSSAPGLQLINSKFVLKNHLWPDVGKAFSPKIGFAYQPSNEDGKLVFRGGFGISYDKLDDLPFINSYENGPGYFDYGLCCAGLQATNPTATGTGIIFNYGTSDSPFSYPANPNLNTGINPITGTPNAYTPPPAPGAPPPAPFTPQIETYSASPNTKQPTLYDYSFGFQYELPYQMALMVGYQGSSGYHFLRLVDQNFLYTQSNGTCATGGTCTPGVNQSPFYAAYVPTTDVHTSYNALNVSLNKRMQHGVEVDANYTWSKSLDNASNEGPGAVTNQTNPAYPRTEYGPSDFDVRHRVTVLALWSLPSPAGNRLQKQVLGGWQASAVFTYHTGYPWTPTIGVPSVALVNGAAVISPTRPLAYGPAAGLPLAGNSCSNAAYVHNGNFPLGGPAYFAYPGNHLPSTATGQPGIGRNSWNGPCYLDTDMSFGKQFTFAALHHPTSFRFQANIYNIFNKQNLLPLAFGSSETNISNPLFGLSPGADSGRVIEFFGRFEF